MATYKVYYHGYYIVEADTKEDAADSHRDDGSYEEWENYDAVLMEDYDG